MKNSVKILLGLTSVFIAGAAVGALYAPDKGERTRRRIARKGNRLYYTVSDALEEGKESLEEMRDRMKDHLQKVNDEIERVSRSRCHN